jgi:outer membrane lipoprotein SlyB
MIHHALRTAAIVIAAVTSVSASSALAQAPASPQCADCGVVQSIRYVEQEGQGSGVGAVAGGVLGSVLGHQVGSGRGNTVATIAGAAGGAYVGNKVEKNRKKTAYWSVSLRMDGGQARTFTYTNKPAVKEGERVKLVDGGKRLALLAN